MGLDAPTPPKQFPTSPPPLPAKAALNGGVDSDVVPAAAAANGHVTTTTAIVEQPRRGPVLQTGL